MPKRAIAEITRTDLLEHPAVKAWSKLQPSCGEPRGLEVLQGEKEKSAVYRLEGVGPGGSTVIAKRCGTTTASIERTIYEEVLPHLPIGALHYYGFTEETDSCWLFLEDVGNERFSPLVEEHRVLAGRWLGLMHTSATRVAATARLPRRGPRHYLEHLQSARRTILRHLDNPALTDPDDLAALETILTQCDTLELHWSHVERCCEGMPSTLVHGDFRPKNIRVRTDQTGTRLFPMDWETAGWGVPAADLAPARGLSPVHQVDIRTYWSIVRECWPSLDVSAIERLANVGRVFRRLAAIDWESPNLAYEWLQKPIQSMRIYHAELSEAMKTIELE